MSLDDQFADRYNEFLTKAGIPEGHGRFTACRRMLNGSLSCYRDRCQLGRRPKVMSSFQEEVRTLLNHIRNRHGESYDETSVVAWLLHDGENPFVGVGVMDQEILQAIQTLTDQICFEEGIDVVFSPDEKNFIYKSIHDAARCFLDPKSNRTYHVQMLAHQTAKAFFTDIIKKVAEESNNKKKSKRTRKAS